MNRAATPRTRMFNALPRLASPLIGLFVALLLACSCAMPLAAHASGSVSTPPKSSAPTEGKATSLESAASDASKTGEKVAMSLIGLALALAAIVLAFRRDFKEAVGVLAIGVVAIFLADKNIGVHVLTETVEKLFPS